MVNHGLQPVPLDPRDFSYHLTFGGISPAVLPDEFNVDSNGDRQDQNADGFPYGCTGYCNSDNPADRDHTRYKPIYTYAKTCDMEGHGYTAPCDIRASLKSTQIYGLQKLNENTDQEAEQHRGGYFYNIYDDGQHDWYDSIRLAIFKEGIGASLGTPWFPSWSGVRGQLPMPTPTELKNYMAFGWHNYAAKGWDNGRLLLKTWQGDKAGEITMSREVANVVLELRGACVFIQSPYKPSTATTIKISILEQLIVYLYRLRGLIRLN